MATDKDFPKIEAQNLTGDMDELEKEEESHLSINYTSYNYSVELHNRHTPLRTKLGKIIGRVYTKVRSKFKSHHCCVWSSKAVVLILLWNLIISIVFKSFFDPNLYTVMFNDIDLFNDNDDYFLVMLIYGLPYGLVACCSGSAASLTP